MQCNSSMERRRQVSEGNCEKKVPCVGTTERERALETILEVFSIVSFYSFLKLSY